jgi:hypothetical protein
MAGPKPEVHITQLVDKLPTKFQRLYPVIAQQQQTSRDDPKNDVTMWHLSRDMMITTLKCSLQSTRMRLDQQKGLSVYTNTMPQ